MTAQTKNRWGFWQSLFKGGGSKGPEVAPAVAEPSVQAAAPELERIEQELRVACLIQKTLLPKTLPELSGCDVAAYYQPAREVGDVTDKVMPAALEIATTRTMLRAAAQRRFSPSLPSSLAGTGNKRTTSPW